MAGQDEVGRVQAHANRAVHRGHGVFHFGGGVRRTYIGSGGETK